MKRLLLLLFLSLFFTPKAIHAMDFSFSTTSNVKNYRSYDMGVAMDFSNEWSTEVNYFRDLDSGYVSSSSIGGRLNYQYSPDATFFALYQHTKEIGILIGNTLGVGMNYPVSKWWEGSWQTLLTLELQQSRYQYETTDPNFNRRTWSVALDQDVTKYFIIGISHERHTYSSNRTTSRIIDSRNLKLSERLGGIGYPDKTQAASLTFFAFENLSLKTRYSKTEGLSKEGNNEQFFYSCNVKVGILTLSPSYQKIRSKNIEEYYSIAFSFSH